MELALGLIICFGLVSFFWGTGLDAVNPRGSGKSNGLSCSLLLLSMLCAIPIGLWLADLLYGGG